MNIDPDIKRMVEEKLTNDKISRVEQLEEDLFSIYEKYLRKNIIILTEYPPYRGIFADHKYKIGERITTHGAKWRIFDIEYGVILILKKRIVATLVYKVGQIGYKLFDED